MLAWVIRGVLGLGVLMLGIVALGSRSPAEPPSPTPDAAEGPPMVAPAATTGPFVERVVSRVARETPPAYPTSTPVAGGAALVSIVDFGYLPGVVRIHVGQTVVWRNDGREAHDVTGDDWHSGQMEPTVDYHQTFGVTGTFNFRCSIHPDMTGTVIVQ